MKHTVGAPLRGNPERKPQKPMRRSYGLGLFLLSAGTLLLELSLTRVLSVSLWYHFAFMIISIALLGTGISGAFLAVWKGGRTRPLDDLLLVFSAGFALCAMVSFWVMNRIPLAPFNLLVDRRQWFFLPAYCVVVTVPFFFSGAAIGLLLSRRTDEVNRLYFFDLLGAGLGCTAIVLTMPAAGGSGSVMAACLLGLLAAVTFGWPSRRRWCWGLLLIAVLVAGATPFAERLLPITVTPTKLGEYESMQDMDILFTKWNSFSRVDVRRIRGEGSSGEVRDIVIDGGAALTGLPRVRVDLAQAPPYENVRAMAVSVLDTPRTLAIGSGGGPEVLSALTHGAPSVTAVEINPIINDLVRGAMREWVGGLFDDPRVRLVTDEGRSFVRRSRETYDVILSAYTISNAAVSSGALGLSENYLLTVEAFEDYVEHLSARGMIYFVRPEFQLPRLFATAVEVTRARDEDPTSRLVAFRKRAPRAWLGVSLQPVTPAIAARSGTAGPYGALVSRVLAREAGRSGLRRGDVLVELDGLPVDSVVDLRLRLARMAPGRRVLARVIRSGVEYPLAVPILSIRTTPSFVAGLAMKRSPFTPEELRRMEAFFDRWDLEFLYRPYARSGEGTVYRELLAAPDLEEVYRRRTENLRPATDDRPFFNRHTKWSSIGLESFRRVFTQGLRGRFALEDMPIVETILLAVLAYTALLSILFILGPLYLFRREGLEIEGRGRILVYFAALGLGFILVEIVLIQQFTLFLGEPTYTLMVVIASLLVFSGVGSRLADRFRDDPIRALTRIIPILIVLVLAERVGMPWAFRAALGLPLPLRVTTSILLIAPLGLLMGMPFPLGLRLVDLRAPRLTPWAWGVNGFFSVIGSVLSMILGMTLGFKAALAIGAGLYGVALLAMAVGGGQGDKGTRGQGDR